ncbi:MAG TPA: DUF3426 domain-containing protein [Rhodocyclaceae bacterium]
MLTRCPRCATTFRVTPDQLKARHGRVRCGACQEVFDALESLIEAAAQAVPAPPHVVPVQTDAAAPAAIADDPRPPLQQDAAPEAAAQQAPQPAPIPPQAAETAAADTAPPPELPATPAAAIELPPEEAMSAEPSAETAAPTEEPEDAASEEEDGADAPGLEPLLHDEPRPSRLPWVLASVVALFVLLMQAAIHYRTELAVLSPGAKPLLEALCVPVGCNVPLPRKPDLLGIETSSLSPDAGGKLALSASLKNRAPFAQQFPDLELTLSDINEKPLVRRVLAPADYLTPDALAAGFAADSEVAVNLLVDAPGIPAAGYQLYLFYP